MSQTKTDDRQTDTDCDRPMTVTIHTNDVHASTSTRVTLFAVDDSPRHQSNPYPYVDRADHQYS